MRTLISLLIVLLFLPAFAQETTEQTHPNINKTMNITKADEAPEIDGFIDPVWADADSVEISHQQMPFFGQAPSYRTVAKILTTVDALYCIIIAYDIYQITPRSGIVIERNRSDLR